MRFICGVQAALNIVRSLERCSTLMPALLSGSSAFFSLWRWSTALCRTSSTARWESSSRLAETQSSTKRLRSSFGADECAIRVTERHAPPRVNADVNLRRESPDTCFACIRPPLSAVGLPLIVAESSRDGAQRPAAGVCAGVAEVNLTRVGRRHMPGAGARWV